VLPRADVANARHPASQPARLHVLLQTRNVKEQLTNSAWVKGMTKVTPFSSDDEKFSNGMIK